MAEGEEWIAATQEGLGKLIAKPKMTEKYLKKPPFRFLHDIIMEVQRTTGFGQGLYTPEESEASSMSEKNAKVEFLNKAISVVSFALGEKIDVSANKIVAGLEADKTNLWLQKLHAAATTAADKSPEAVQRVLNGETVAAPKKKKPKDEESEKPPENATGDGGDHAAEEEAKKEEDKRRRAERKKREEEKKRKAEEEAKTQEEANNAPGQETVPAPSDHDEEAERKARKEEERRKKEEDRARRKQKQADEEAARQQAEAEAQQLAQQQQQQQYEAQLAQQQQQQYEAQLAQQQAAEEEQRRLLAQQQGMMPEETPQDVMQSAPGSANQPTRPLQEPQSAEELAMMQQQQLGGEDEMGMRPGKVERPRTAGRKPPRVTSKVKTNIDEPGVTQAAPPPMIIAEGQKDDDDDDMFEDQQAPSFMAMPGIKADSNEPHGKLVADLLSEKKKEDQERIRREEEETREEVEEPGSKSIKMGKLRRKKDQVSSYTEIDTAKLSEQIQQLCQAANPLGKSIDLVHQDISNMGKELDQWKNEYRDASDMYQQQLKLTDEQLQPLYQKIAELDEKIDEQKAKIRNSRSRISKSDLKIQSLLESVVMAK